MLVPGPSLSAVSTWSGLDKGTPLAFASQGEDAVPEAVNFMVTPDPGLHRIFLHFPFHVSSACPIREDSLAFSLSQDPFGGPLWTVLKWASGSP